MEIKVIIDKQFINLTASDWILLITALILVLTAWFTYKAATATNDNTKTQIFYDILKAYSTDKMHTDLRLLRGWVKNHKTPKEAFDLFGEKFRADSTDVDFQDVNKARRRVKTYFSDSLFICTEKKIPKNLLNHIFEYNGIEILFSIVEPLEKAMVEDEDYKRGDFDDMFKIVKSGNDPFNIKRVVDEI